MRGALFYDEVGAKKNEWFIRRLQTLAKKENIELKLRIFSVQEDLEALEQEPFLDFALVRCICPKLNERLETLGVKVFNNAETSKKANDKWETYKACKKWGIPVLKTELFESGAAPKNYPCVMKTTDGHGGAEVFWLSEKEDFLKAEETTRGRRKILQEPCEILGKDMRIYAIGGEIVAAVLRTSENDFRSNFSLGGRVELATPDETQIEIIKTLYEKLKFEFVGIDFLPTKKGWVLNEIEDAAGARMLYKVSKIDIAALMIKHIKQTVKA